MDSADGAKQADGPAESSGYFSFHQSGQGQPSGTEKAIREDCGTLLSEPNNNITEAVLLVELKLNSVPTHGSVMTPVSCHWCISTELFLCSVVCVCAWVSVCVCIGAAASAKLQHINGGRGRPEQQLHLSSQRNPGSH